VVEGQCVSSNAEEGFGVVVGDEPPGAVWVHFSDIEASGAASFCPASRLTSIGRNRAAVKTATGSAQRG
jgi:hypothetical protein